MSGLLRVPRNNEQWSWNLMSVESVFWGNWRLAGAGAAAVCACSPFSSDCMELYKESFCREKRWMLAFQTLLLGTFHFSIFRTVQRIGLGRSMFSIPTYIAQCLNAMQLAHTQVNSSSPQRINPQICKKVPRVLWEFAPFFCLVKSGSPLGVYAHWDLWSQLCYWQTVASEVKH